jgi:hypothetical protein
MKAVVRRIDRLEERFEPEPEEEPLLAVVTHLDRKLALDKDACLQILRECGFLRGGPMGVVKLSDIPGGLNAVELKMFLREHGSEIVIVSG